MSDQYTNEPLLDMFLHETTHLLEQLEQSILSCEKEKDFSEKAINEIFRNIHTIKGSAAMMLFDNISKLAHSIEDLLHYLRQEKLSMVDNSALSDLLLEGIDFIQIEVEKIRSNNQADGNAEELIKAMKEYFSVRKQEKVLGEEATQTELVEQQKQQYYISQVKFDLAYDSNIFKATIHFEDGCEMENIRAYTIIHDLKDLADEIFYLPGNILDSDESIRIIRQKGFQIYLKIDYSYKKMYEFFMRTILLKDLELVQLVDDTDFKQFEQAASMDNSIKIPVLCEELRIGIDKVDFIEQPVKDIQPSATLQKLISVSVLKLDKLMELIGEMVIAETMVVQNPDLNGLKLANFEKAARQLNKITDEMKDMVMSIRMVPLTAAFKKMHRIVRDMSKKLDKEVFLDIIGEGTEVDKNIIEHISDSLMHLVRNSIDHGIESANERHTKGKTYAGTITIEAKNSGSEVIIIVKDDGKGLNKEKILKKAKESNLLIKNEQDMTDIEIFNLILLPGFSTKEIVTEFSGRGVGMDVVTKNIEAVGGSLSVDSVIDKGTMITLKIPLTLAVNEYQ